MKSTRYDDAAIGLICHQDEKKIFACIAENVVNNLLLEEGEVVYGYKT